MTPNLMTETTRSKLKRQLEELEKELAEARLAVGEAAGSSHDWHDNFPSLLLQNLGVRY